MLFFHHQHFVMPFLLRMYYILVNSFLAPLGPHRFCPTFRDTSSYWALSPILRSFLSILSELPYCTIVILFSHSPRLFFGIYSVASSFTPLILTMKIPAFRHSLRCPTSDARRSSMTPSVPVASNSRSICGCHGQIIVHDLNSTLESPRDMDNA